MKIECLARREGGTAVNMGSAVYHFLPDETGRHVAEVTDPKHIANFATIPEGFVLEGEPQATPAADPVAPAPKKGRDLPPFPKGKKK
jgi:hypothetical protein